MTETESMRVSVAGEESFCLGFKLAGVNASYELNTETFTRRIDEIMDKEQGVLIVEADHMNSLTEKKRLTLQNSVEPVVIPIGGDAESSDLQRKIKQAIGIDIWD